MPYTSLVKWLSPNRRNLLSDAFIKFAFMAAAGLIFGQFVPDQEINKEVVMSGLILTWLLVGLAVITKPK